jgi:hypothetical protein
MNIVRAKLRFMGVLLNFGFEAENAMNLMESPRVYLARRPPNLSSYVLCASCLIYSSNWSSARTGHSCAINSIPNLRKRICS